MMNCTICDYPAGLPDSHMADDCPFGDGIDPEEAAPCLRLTPGCSVQHLGDEPCETW